MGRDDIVLLGGFITTVAIVCAVLFSMIVTIDNYMCGVYAAETGRATKFEGFVCYVSSNDAWYTRSEYKATITAKDAIK